MDGLPAEQRCQRLDATAIADGIDAISDALQRSSLRELSRPLGIKVIDVEC
jgi:hypothetical protein